MKILVTVSLTLCVILPACNPLVGNLDKSTVQEGFNPGLPNSEKEQAPVAIDLALTTNKNVAGSSHLPASDDNANDTLTFKLETLPTKGAVTITDQASGAFTYTPNLNAIGSDSFTFKASDGKLESNTATVTITINDTYTAPVTANISPSAFSEDTQSGAIVLSYSDPDGDLATACAISNAQNVSVTQSCACNGAGVCTVKVTGSANFHGAASFDYSVTAASQTSNVATATLTINAVDDAPTTANITPSAFNEDAQSGLITLSYSASGGDLGTTCTISNLSNVTVTQACACSGTGVCTLKVTGTANYYGSAGFDYTVSAGTATSNTSAATLSIAQLGDDALTANAYGFDTGDHANYDFADGNGSTSTILGSVLSFASNLVKLIKADQIDNSTYGFGAGHGESFTGGAQYDSSTGREYVRLSTTSPNLELDASWTPAWPNLVGYWKMNGSVGSVSNGASVLATVGADGTANNGGSGMSFGTAILSQGLLFDGSDDRVAVTTVSSPKITISAWVKATGTSGTYPRIVEFPGYNLFFGFVSGDPDNNYRIKFGSARATAAGVWATPISSVALNNWYHVVASYDGTSTSNNVVIYVNGVASTITTLIAPVGAQTSNVGTGYIGNRAGNDRGWQGTLDDVAVWNTNLSAEAVQAIYQHQAGKYSGTFTSRPMNAFSASQSWTSLAWTPTLPFYKALSDAGQSESQAGTGYSSLYNSSLMSDIAGLWHFDGLSQGIIPDNTDVADKSGKTGVGKIKDSDTSNTISAVTGRLGLGISFDGANDFVEVPSSSDLIFSSSVTVSTWFYTTANGTLQPMVAKGGNSLATAGYQLGLNDSGRISFKLNIAGVLKEALYNFSSTFEWHHLVGVYNGSEVRLFLDGKLAHFTSASGNITDSGSPLYIGKRNGNGFFKGVLDEVAIWSRALDPAEILQLYRRGANRILYQAKSCADSSCVCKTIAAVTGTANDCDGDGVANSSDLNDANLAQWLGPDGTNQSYFSELNNTDTYNTASSTTTGAVLPTLPSLSFAKFGAPLTTHLSNNRYFQYRAIMESDDANNLCDYGGGAGTAPCSPELKVVGVGPDHYSKDKPYLIGKNPVAFYNLSGFTEALSITPGCGGGVKYQLSTNKTTWKWWDGDSWETTTDVTTAEANTQAQLNTAGVVSTFGSAVGRGSVYFRAFLGSNGQQPCELDTVTFSGAK